MDWNAKDVNPQIVKLFNPFELSLLRYSTVTYCHLIVYRLIFYIIHFHLNEPNGLIFSNETISFNLKINDYYLEIHYEIKTN